MEYKFVGNKLEIKGVSDFNLDQTFECGQCFRWIKIDENFFHGVAFDKYLKILRKNDELIFLDTTVEDFKNLWRHYFDFDRDYLKIKNKLSKISPTMKLACDYAPGIRILHQDPWEALCSFIISQNNNIPRIRGIIDRLCMEFGNKIQDNIYSFPKPSNLANLQEEDLNPLRSGFRAKYILDAAKKIDSGEIDLESIISMNLSDARDELMKIKGVGPKVAECTLLYGFNKLEAFPMDVWMKRAMSELFEGYSPTDFGKYAGIAQQYIFHYARTNRMISEK